MAATWRRRRCGGAGAAVLTLAAIVVDGCVQQPPPPDREALASGVLEPLNAVGDRHGCTLENGVVRTPPGFGDAYHAYCGAGWNRLTVSAALGGQAGARLLREIGVTVSGSSLLRALRRALSDLEESRAKAQEIGRAHV